MRVRVSEDEDEDEDEEGGGGGGEEEEEGEEEGEEEVEEEEEKEEQEEEEDEEGKKKKKKKKKKTTKKTKKTRTKTKHGLPADKVEPEGELPVDQTWAVDVRAGTPAGSTLARGRPRLEQGCALRLWVSTMPRYALIGDSAVTMLPQERSLTQQQSKGFAHAGCTWQLWGSNPRPCGLAP
jgi:hypothetical protein